jgi:hypothetical protein
MTFSLAGVAARGSSVGNVLIAGVCVDLALIGTVLLRTFSLRFSFGRVPRPGCGEATVRQTGPNGANRDRDATLLNTCDRLTVCAALATALFDGKLGGVPT